MEVLTFHDGDAMPVLGMGTWLISPDEAYHAIREAIQIGYRHFDCASFYGNEAEIGSAIKDAISDGEVTRRDLWITSKLWNNNHHPADVRPALQKTLDDLEIDFLDLYLIHWPVTFKSHVKAPSSVHDLLPPGEIPLSDTWSAMIDCCREGMTTHIGVSNFNSRHIDILIEDTGVTPELNQFEIHPYLPQTDLVSYCHSRHIHVTAYGSLANSAGPERLTEAGLPALLDHPVVKDISLRRGMTPAQVVLRWSIDRGIAVIPKSVHASRMRQNLDTLNFRLHHDDTAALNGLDSGFRCVTGIHWNQPGSPYSEKWVWS